MRHRFAIFICLCTWVLIVSGAFVKNSERASGQAQSQVTAAIFNERTHLGLGVGVVFLTLALAIWLSSTRTRGLAWLCLALLTVDAALGIHAAPLPAALGILHACLSPLFLAGLTALAILTSSSWERGPEPVDSSKWPSLPSLATATPVAAILQIALGASYRHEVLSVMPHMAGAMAVVLISLVVSVVTLQTYPAHRILKNSSTALIGIIITQVCLGITTFILPLIDLENTLAYALATAGHVATGALALAASVVLAIQVRRHVRSAI